MNIAEGIAEILKPHGGELFTKERRAKVALDTVELMRRAGIDDVALIVARDTPMSAIMILVWMKTGQALAPEDVARVLETPVPTGAVN